MSPKDEETTSSSPEIIPVFLEDSTQPTKETTESEPMEALNEMMTSLPDEETTSESAQWENLPWVRIGLIAGVLLVTAVALCVLKAQQKI
ncbi:uncharacterized protein LOC141786186 [Halichoeres trimaculatus]|uniref:uncharacterized protein LOC141786186 n=1 Tax=Halichoeres trimaculatus TaxID=147232 RepID=UPI003D9E5DEA